MNEGFSEMLLVRQLSEWDFKRFALNIVQLLCDEQKKRIYKGDMGRAVLMKYVKNGLLFGPWFDALAPSGVYDSSFSVVEVRKTSRKISEAIKEIEQIVNRFIRLFVTEKDNFSFEGSAKLLLIISGSRLVKQHFWKTVTEGALEKVIDIWSIDDLLERAKVHSFEYNAFLELVISRVSNSNDIKTIRKETKDVTHEEFQKQNDSLIDELRGSFDSHQVSLVLGTGVSMDYNDNLSWKALSDRLYSHLDPEKRFDNQSVSISILGGDNVSAVQYSKSNLGKRYPKVLYELIYPKKKAYKQGLTSLDECANLIIRKRGRQRRIDKVITYNYDDYFEQSLKARGFSCRALYLPFDFLGEETPIYHVHGYLPEECAPSERGRYIETIVLSEEDYFKCYGDSSNWNVAIQLETFKDDICLFVGNSIADFNEKRLLNKTKQDKGKTHFAIIYTQGLNFSDLAKIYMHFFYELNVKIIWAESLAEIPSIIRKI